MVIGGNITAILENRFYLFCERRHLICGNINYELHWTKSSYLVQHSCVPFLKEKHSLKLVGEHFVWMRVCKYRLASWYHNFSCPFWSGFFWILLKSRYISLSCPLFGYAVCPTGVVWLLRAWVAFPIEPWMKEGGGHSYIFYNFPNFQLSNRHGLKSPS